MKTTIADLKKWFKDGKSQGKEFLLVVCDTFNWEDYPVYCSASDFDKHYRKYNGANMQQIMEVYDLSKKMDDQVASRRVFNYPEGFMP